MEYTSLHDYYYDLPEQLIAQTPLEKRDTSRLMVLNKEKKTVEHKMFYDICSYLKKGDVLVINETKVLPVRLYGKKKDTGAALEVLLQKRLDANRFEVIVRPGKKAKIGAEFVFGDGELIGTVEQLCDGGNRIMNFSYEGDFYALLDKVGVVPLPPYIKEKLEDKDRYQTVYAKNIGSSAAPTAGFHFTKELLEKVKELGVIIAPVTLHVGLGTFRPVKCDNILEHKMHSEYYEISDESAEIINNAKTNGNRVICVGTTSCRTVESAADENGMVRSGSADTEIFIYPGYKFKAMDALITNFHLPESTLIMLVSAFADHDFILDAYNTAVKEKYRFFSFGDAMFIYND